MEHETKACIARFLQLHGEQALLEILSAQLRSEQDVYTLTIVCNEGTHAIPKELIRGDEFVLSQGNIEMSSSSLIEEEMRRVLAKLAAKLKQKNWRSVYIIPSGHPVLYAHAKLLVFRVTRIETVDWLYLGHGAYTDVNVEQRPLITEAREVGSGAS